MTVVSEAAALLKQEVIKPHEATHPLCLHNSFSRKKKKTNCNEDLQVFPLNDLVIRVKSYPTRRRMIIRSISHFHWSVEVHM